jgi:hypothetical protein
MGTNYRRKRSGKEKYGRIKSQIWLIVAQSNYSFRLVK